MVHGQVFPPHLPVAVMANPLLDSAVPPVGTSQAPGLFLFSSYLFIADSAEIEAHIYPNPDEPEQKRPLAKAPRRKENLQPIRNPKNA